MTRRRAALAVPLTVAALLAAASTALAVGPATGAAPVPAASYSASDPAGDVVVGGSLEPLLGSQEVYDSVDLTSVTGSADATNYVVTLTTAGPATGAADILVLTTEARFDVSWKTLNRRGVRSEIAQNLVFTVGADGVEIETDSLPPRCRNASGFSVTSTEADGAGVLTITVPRICTRPTIGVVFGVADITVRSRGFGPAGTAASSYSDDATALGAASVAPPRTRRG